MSLVRCGAFLNIVVKGFSWNKPFQYLLVILCCGLAESHAFHLKAQERSFRFAYASLTRQWHECSNERQHFDRCL